MTALPHRRRTLPALALCGLMLGASAHAPAPRGDEAPACEHRTFEGSGFVVCVYRPGADQLRLELDGRDGPLGGLRALKRFLGPRARDVRFAMNGGMYDGAQRPLGLLIRDGREVRPARRGEGAGNFYLLPNGVFSVDASGAPRVEETEAFLARGSRPVWATQSGPLLLQAGRVHPAIMANGQSVFVRNGVGVPDSGRAYFVISDKPVAFGRFARFFRDGLGCADALYLDGKVSVLWAPELGRLDRRTGLGPLIVVSRR